jgi:hypothetical protein
MASVDGYQRYEEIANREQQLQRIKISDDSSAQSLVKQEKIGWGYWFGPSEAQRTANANTIENFKSDLQAHIDRNVSVFTGNVAAQIHSLAAKQLDQLGTGSQAKRLSSRSIKSVVTAERLLSGAAEKACNTLKELRKSTGDGRLYSDHVLQKAMQKVNLTEALRDTEVDGQDPRTGAPTGQKAKLIGADGGMIRFPNKLSHRDQQAVEKAILDAVTSIASDERQKLIAANTERFDSLTNVENTNAVLRQNMCLFPGAATRSGFPLPPRMTDELSRARDGLKQEFEAQLGDRELTNEMTNSWETRLVELTVQWSQGNQAFAEENPEINDLITIGIEHEIGNTENSNAAAQDTTPRSAELAVAFVKHHVEVEQQSSNPRLDANKVAELKDKASTLLPKLADAQKDIAQSKSSLVDGKGLEGLGPDEFSAQAAALQLRLAEVEALTKEAVSLAKELTSIGRDVGSAHRPLFYFGGQIERMAGNIGKDMDAIGKEIAEQTAARQAGDEMAYGRIVSVVNQASGESGAFSDDRMMRHIATLAQADQEAAATGWNFVKNLHRDPAAIFNAGLYSQATDGTLLLPSQLTVEQLQQGIAAVQQVMEKTYETLAPLEQRLADLAASNVHSDAYATLDALRTQMKDKVAAPMGNRLRNLQGELDKRTAKTKADQEAFIGQFGQELFDELKDQPGVPHLGGYSGVRLPHLEPVLKNLRPHHLGAHNQPVVTEDGNVSQAYTALTKSVEAESGLHDVDIGQKEKASPGWVAMQLKNLEDAKNELASMRSRLPSHIQGEKAIIEHNGSEDGQAAQRRLETLTALQAAINKRLDALDQRLQAFRVYISGSLELQVAEVFGKSPEALKKLGVKVAVDPNSITSDGLSSALEKAFAQAIDAVDLSFAKDDSHLKERFAQAAESMRLLWQKIRALAATEIPTDVEKPAGRGQGSAVQNRLELSQKVGDLKLPPSDETKKHQRVNYLESHQALLADPTILDMDEVKNDPMVLMESSVSYEKDPLKMRQEVQHLATVRREMRIASQHLQNLQQIRDESKGGLLRKGSRDVHTLVSGLIETFERLMTDYQKHQSSANRRQ